MSSIRKISKRMKSRPTIEGAGVHLKRAFGFPNLPASHKMMDPRYQDIKSVEVPEVKLDHVGAVRVLAGTFNEITGPVKDIITDPEYLDVTLDSDAAFSHQINKEYTAFAYVISGTGYFEPDHDPYGFEMEGKNYFDFKRDCLAGSEELIIYEKGDAVTIQSGNQGLRFLLVSGKPIGEPVAWYGPIVMNTQEELEIAFDEYQKGTFLKHQQKN